MYKDSNRVFNKIYKTIIGAYLLLAFGNIFLLLIILILFMVNAKILSIIYIILFYILWFCFSIAIYRRISYRTVVSIKQDEDYIYVECYKKTYKYCNNTKIESSDGISLLLLYFWKENKKTIFLVPKYVTSGFKRINNIDYSFLSEFKNVKSRLPSVFDEVFK